MLFLYQQTEQALLNLNAFKLRSALAILGILIGTAAIVALISCSRLGTEKALEAFRSLDTNLIAMTVFQDTQHQHAKIKDIPLTVWRSLPSHISDIAEIAPFAIAYQSLHFKNHPYAATVIGADETLSDIIHIQMASGHFVSYLESYEQVCVIGETLAKQLHHFSLDDLLGQQLQIGHLVYTIIGIADHWTENQFFNDNVNQAVIIPIKGMVLLNKDAQINEAIARLKPRANLDQTMDQIKQIVHQKSPLLGIYIRSAKQIIKSLESQGHIFTILLGIIGSISMIVGGIGVMNVMLVSVGERKKEIGIRKAIGANNQDIQTLFLVESILLAMFGGILGCILGLLLTWIIAHFSDWPFRVYLMPYLAGFGVSIITGIFFGFYPAYRAACLQPIEALRAE